jgi:hypothetical protein
MTCRRLRRRQSSGTRARCRSVDGCNGEPRASRREPPEPSTTCWRSRPNRCRDSAGGIRPRSLKVGSRGTRRRPAGSAAPIHFRCGSACVTAYMFRALCSARGCAIPEPDDGFLDAFAQAVRPGEFRRPAEQPLGLGVVAAQALHFARAGARTPASARFRHPPASARRSGARYR